MIVVEHVGARGGFAPSPPDLRKIPCAQSAPSLPHSHLRNTPVIAFSAISLFLTKILSLACSYDLRRADGGGDGGGEGGGDDRKRSRSATSAEHWSDNHVFGTRARFNYGAPSTTPSSKRVQLGHSTPLLHPLSVLKILSVATSDAGIYRCRVDFERAPTRNSMTNLTVVGK